MSIVSGHTDLLREIKERIHSVHYEALKAVNRGLIGLYWDVERMIVEHQRGEIWGKLVVEQLAKDLQAEFIGIQGFSGWNIWYMRRFWIFG